MFNFKNHLMKKYFYLFIIPVFLLASDLLNAQAYCTQPSSYRYTSNANGAWGSTWTTNSSAPNYTYLITHRVTYNSDLKPNSGSVIVIKNGGELVLDQMQTDNPSVTIILDGGKLTITQNLQLKNSGDRICAINGSCITIGEDFQSLSGSQMYFANSGLTVGENLQTTSTVTGTNYKIWVGEDFQNTGGWGSTGVTAWYAGGQNPSGSGWPSESTSSMDPCLCIPPATPTVSTPAGTCSAAGTATVSNYSSGLTYTFSPSGPTIGSGGVISNATAGTSYTITASNGTCSSSASFTRSAQLSTPATPTVSTTAATCSAAGTATITNYSTSLTYVFSPTGPTVGSGGVISNATAGTSYTVRASNSSCSSSNVSFTRPAQLSTPVTPTVSTPAGTCSAAGTATVSNYNSGLTYTFSPTGPTIGSGGVISNATAGTSYTITASNGTCSSSASFTRSAQLSAPATPTINTTAATCSAAGTATVSNYNSGLTYTFSPTGPTIGSGGVISNATAGTSYTITASNGTCSSSASFTRPAQLSTPVTPTVSTTAGTCSAAGTATISNYSASLTYVFSPTGPTVGSGGVISNATAGTSYTVAASNGSCSSSNVSFTRPAQLSAPAIPTVTTTAATCFVAGTATLSNYNATLSYVFSPAGPTVGSGGVISNATANTFYTVTASNGTCTSASSVAFSISSLPSLDSDGDGIPDYCDVDDDNDGILDTAECSNTINDMFAVYSAGGLIDILPSDFGLALGIRNQNVTADLSSKFGYPANSGAVIISINNASVHPTANAWWTKNGEQPSVWNVSGKMSAFVLMSQNPEYYGQDSKAIHILDGATVIPITVPGLANQTAVPGTWSITETPTSKTLTNVQPEQLTPLSPPGGNWRYANMNFGAKTFGFSTTTKYANPTYVVSMYLECDTDGDGIPNRLDLDSDADGCPDAVEGGASILPSGLMTAGGTLSGGSTSVNQNICTTCVSTGGSNIGLPQITTPPSGYSNTTGQTVGDSQNATVNSCPSIVCTSESSMLNTSSVSVTQSGGNGQQAFVIDNDVTAANYWQSSAAGQSLTIDYGQSYILNGMTYYPSTTGNKVLGYTIQTSTDNATFTTVATGTFPDYTTTNLAEKGIPNTVRFSTPVNARYIRMVVADSGKRVAEIVPLVCGLTPIDIICDTVPLVSTGTNATGTGKKAVRNLDNNWTVTHFNGGTGNPATSSYNYSSIANAQFHPAIVVGRAVIVPGNPSQTWATSPYGNAEWVSATQNGFDVNAPLLGDTTSPNTYFYKYKFNISSPLVASSLKLRLDYYVDNQIVRVYVNGVDQNISTTDFLGYANGHEKSTFLTNNFQEGINELVVQIYSQPHYAGLLVQGIESCYCVKDPIPGTPQGYTKVGITNQNKQEAWPGNIPNGHIALESKTKGFVITRVNHVSTVPAPSDSIADPKEGMVVYDIVDKCVKLFNGTNWTCIQRTCNDSN